MNPLKTYEYLCKAREKVISAVGSAGAPAWDHRFEFGLGTIGSTLTHIMISEWYYLERLQERDVPTYDQWPIKYESPPAFAEVQSTWARQAVEGRSVIAAERDWSRPITWLSFPNDQGKRFHIKVTPNDLFTQLALHEVHHRAQIMVMLKQLGRPPGQPLEDLDYNAMMFERVPAEES